MKMKQFVVCGLGRFGISIATTLSDAGYEVMVIDSSEEKIQEISAVVTHAVQADTADIDVMKSLGIRNFDVAIVAIGRDIQSSIMTTLILKELEIPYVVAKATGDLHERVLKKIGADRVVQPEKDMGHRIGNNLISGNILEYIQLSPDYSIVEIPILKEWQNRTIKEVDFRNKYGLNIIAVESDAKIDVSPKPDYSLTPNDLLIVVGSNRQLQSIEAKRYGK
ncbi:potassium transporter Trk [Candidatus Epulonipiscium fishelsonii]|uniref:Potassium transporter Trk n=1 Tax=Candidatus Epulonipiscium fishelsonii TaxID=77094 RepID=A0ACC8XIX8_9FIRM|nr:potassium transporter Trk [Epulopiscium sp. SCG-D08WGA-EpuloA1]